MSERDSGIRVYARVPVHIGPPSFEDAPTTGGTSSIFEPIAEFALLLDRYGRLVDLLTKAGNLPKTEARILTRLIQMMIPDATVSELAEFVAEIRAHVGLDDNA